VLTRPIGDVIVLMPPYGSSPAQVRRMVQTLGQALRQIFGPNARRSAVRKF